MRKCGDGACDAGYRTGRGYGRTKRDEEARGTFALGTASAPPCFRGFFVRDCASAHYLFRSFGSWLSVLSSLAVTRALPPPSPMWEEDGSEWWAGFAGLERKGHVRSGGDGDRYGTYKERQGRGTTERCMRNGAHGYRVIARRRFRSEGAQGSRD